MAIAREGMRERLRAFVQEHPEGWNHHQWLGLLSELTDEGVDTGDPAAIGAALEYERVLAYLESVDVRGLGPKRREAVADRYPRLWDLRQATAEELAELPAFHRGLAEALHEALG